LLLVLVKLFLHTCLGYEHFADLPSHGKIVKLLHGYRSTLNSKICHNSENMK